MKRLLSLAAALLLPFAPACDSPTDGPRTPERPTIALRTPVQGRVAPDSVVEYDLAMPAGEFRILLQARSGRAEDVLAAELVDDTGAPAGRAVSKGTDTALAAQASPWLKPAPERHWRIRVLGQAPAMGGDYTLLLFPRDSAPESVPAAITRGQTVAEAVDVGGDVDEFTLDGAAGDEWILFAQAAGVTDGPINVDLLEPGTDRVMGRVAVSEPTESLEMQSSGRIRLTNPGPYRVRVYGDPFGGEPRGGYRFRVYAVNRAPESGPAALAPGAVVDGALEAVGDVDEFTFTAAAGQELNLMVQLREGMSAGLQVELLSPGAGQLAAVRAGTPTASLDLLGTGRITLDAAGTYTVRVSGPPRGRAAEATGSYRFELYPVDRRPETGGELRLDGGTVSGAIERSGDVDEFPFQGTEGQFVVAYATGGPPTGWALELTLLAASGDTLGTAGVSGFTTPNRMWRVRLPATGTYRARVATRHPSQMGTGSYTIGAYTVGAAPEQVPSAIAIGQTVTGERVDRWGDLDVFTFQGQAGREVNVFLQKAADADSGVIHFSVGPVGSVHAYAGSGMLDAFGTGRIMLENRPYEVAVDPQALRYGGTAHTGGYSLRVFEIDPRPEGRPQAYVLGEMVQREPLYPAGDIDEYTFTLAAPASVRIFWSSTVDGYGHPQTLGNLLDETGSSVWHSQMAERQATLRAGRYRLRVAAWRDGYRGGDDSPATLPYSFRFLPQ